MTINLTDGGNIASAEAFGVGLVGQPQDLTNGGGIASEEAFGFGTLRALPPAGSLHLIRYLKRLQDEHDDGA